MDDFTIARVLHVLAVSMWMGGVAFVTTIVMPFIRRSSPPAERLEAFHHFEGRVAPQTSFWVLLAGASGFWMTWRADLWDRFEIGRAHSELQSLLRTSYAVFCFNKTKQTYNKQDI